MTSWVWSADQLSRLVIDSRPAGPALPERRVHDQLGAPCRPSAGQDGGVAGQRAYRPFRAMVQVRRCAAVLRRRDQDRHTQVVQLLTNCLPLSIGCRLIEQDDRDVGAERRDEQQERRAALAGSRLDGPRASAAGPDRLLQPGRQTCGLAVEIGPGERAAGLTGVGDEGLRFWGGMACRPQRPVHLGAGFPAAVARPAQAPRCGSWFLP